MPFLFENRFSVLKFIKIRNIDGQKERKREKKRKEEFNYSHLLCVSFIEDVVSVLSFPGLVVLVVQNLFEVVLQLVDVLLESFQDVAQKSARQSRLVVFVALFGFRVCRRSTFIVAVAVDAKEVVTVVAREWKSSERKTGTESESGVSVKES